MDQVKSDPRRGKILREIEKYKLIKIPGGGSWAHPRYEAYPPHRSLHVKSRATISAPSLTCNQSKNSEMVNYTLVCLWCVCESLSRRDH